MEKLFPLQMIREKSKMFQVPYENLLIGCAKERLLESFLNSEAGRNNEYAFAAVVGLGIERYRYMKDNCLKLRVLGESISEDQLEEIRKSFAGTDSYLTDTRMLEQDTARAVLEVLVPFDKVALPIQIHIAASPAKRGAIQTVSLPLCYENDRYIVIPCFYPEAELAEAFIECWEKMELFSEMSNLEYIYLAGKTFPLDGRRLSEYMEYYFAQRGLSFTKERCTQVFACEKNAYLKKRWKAYLSKEKRSAPDWNEVMGCIRNMYEPVILILCKDEIFFGDWMPAVGRYL